MNKDQTIVELKKEIEETKECLKDDIIKHGVNHTRLAILAENEFLKEKNKSLKEKIEKAENLNKFTEKAMCFVAHIDNHLLEMGIDGKVVCKICGGDIDDIYREQLKFQPKEGNK